jgi:hypothetical protein
LFDAKVIADEKIVASDVVRGAARNGQPKGPSVQPLGWRPDPDQQRELAGSPAGFFVEPFPRSANTSLLGI